MSKHRHDRHDDILTQMFLYTGKANPKRKNFYFLRRIYRGKLIYWI